MLKAIITIEFEKVAGQKVTNEMAKSKPFKKATEKTIKLLCGHLDKYFDEKKIKSKTTYEIKAE